MESPWAPLRRRVFFVLWLAQLGSNIGTWMQTVGAQWFLVDAGSSATTIALVQTATMAPALLFALYAGVLADSHDRRRVLVVMNMLAALAASALTVVAAVGVLDPTWLLAFTFIIGSGVALSAPAWQAIQPELVPREEIPAAAALGSVTVNLARAVGPAVAGLLVAIAGPAFVFGVNAASFIAAAVAIYAWRRPAPASTVTGREPAVDAFRSGLRYIRSAPHIRRILLRTALFVIPGSALWALLPVAANGHLDVGPNGYGLLLGALGVGALLGVILLPRLRQRLSANTVLSMSAVAFGVGTLATGYLPPLATALLLMVAGAAWIGNLTTFNSAMQLTVSPWVRARGLAGYMLVMQGSQALGALAWGAAADAFGYPVTLAASGVLLVLLPLSVLFWPLPASTGTLDRTISPLADDLTAPAAAPVESSGPVTVHTRYRIDPADLAEFVAGMSAVRLYRLRTGATSWSLLKSVDDPTLLTEVYTLPTWAELVRQEQERTTGEDHKLLARVNALLVEHPSTTRHLPS
jgi:MFS family permease